MDKIPFEDGTLVTAGYVEIDGVKYETVQPEYTGKTPLSAYNLKKMQDNVENSINEEKLVKRINISGASKQETREGYNKLKNTATTQTINGVTFTVNKDGTVIVNGTATANAGMTFEGDWAEYTKGTYRLTGCPSGGSASTYRIIVWKEGYVVNAVDIGNGTKVTFDGTTKYKTQIFIESGVTVNNLIFKPMITEETESKPYEQYGASPSIEYEAPIESVGDNIQLFDKDNPITLNGYLYNGKIVSSDNTNIIIIIPIKPSKTYSISKMLQATANKNRLSLGTTTDYPVAGATLNVAKINSDGTTKTSETITSSENDNYLVAQIYTKDTTSLEEMLSSIKIVEGISTGAYSPYGQGSIEIKQSARNLANYTDEVTSSSIVNFDIGDVVKGKNYTIYIDLKGTLSFNLKYKLLNTTIKTIYNKTGIYVYNFTATETDILHFNGFSGNGYTGAKVMLLEGTYTTETIPPYEKYQGQTKALYTQQPFRAIGDVKDRFVKVDGANKEQHHIKRIIADGVNYLVGYVFPMGYAMLKDSTKTNIVAKAVKDWAKNGNIICNKLKTVSQADIQQRSYSGVAINNEGYVMIKLDDSAEENIWTTESINNFLSENPLTIDYELATPTLIECTPEQVEALNDIYSAYGKGMTNIICNDEIEPVIEIVKETKETVQSDNDKAISALIARVAELESIVATLQNTTAEEGA